MQEYVLSILKREYVGSKRISKTASPLVHVLIKICAVYLNIHREREREIHNSIRGVGEREVSNLPDKLYETNVSSNSVDASCSLFVVSSYLWFGRA
jgi:hypothetical protein